MEPVKPVVLRSKSGSLPLTSWQWGAFYFSALVAMHFPLRDPCSYTHTKHTTLSRAGFHSPAQRHKAVIIQVQGGEVAALTGDRVFNECHYILMKPIGCAQNGHKPL